MALFLLTLVSLASADPLRTGGLRLHYLDRGQGAPVVLLHGLGASARLNWGLPGIIDNLARDYRVIALDCRGHGQSDRPEIYGKAMVEDVTALLDHLQLQRAHLVGYSMGAMIALRFAVDHPERARSVTLGGMGMLRQGGPMQFFWENVGRGRNATPPACARGFAELAVSDQEVRALRMPIAVLVGDRDPCRQLYVRPLQKLRPDIPVEVIEKSGHFTAMLKPQFKKALRKALAATH